MNRVAFIASLLLSCSTVLAQLPSGPNDYPQWRGPNRDGMSNDKGLLKEWPEAGPQIAWQIDNVGVGYSAIAIKDGIIVTMGDLNGVEHIIAVKVEDGSRLWAVQPKPVSEALAAKIDAEFKNLDRNEDGKVDEVEALSRLGWNFNKYDSGGTAAGVAARAAYVVAGLDANKDGKLNYAEAGNQFREHFLRMETIDEKKAPELAESRAQSLIAEKDADKDDKITREESRGSYLDRIFNSADQKDPKTNNNDQILTRQEIVTYLLKREKGTDGLLTADEVKSYYEKHVADGDGILTRDELKGLHGGYRNGQGDGPRGTPTIDGERVYAEGGNGDLTCLDLKTGETLWHTSMTKDLGGGRPGWGYSESPMIQGDLLIVTPGGKSGTLAALNKMTGEVVWRSEQATEGAHYSSPIVATIGGVKQVVQFARENVFGVTLDKGELLWKYNGANNGTANCCTAIVAKDHVFVASSYGTGGGLAKITDDNGAQNASEVYFEKKMSIHHGGIVLIGDYMYTNGGGSLICIEFLTGKIAWQNRSVGKGSLVAADGMLYVLSERQELALVEATPEEYRESGRIKMQGHGRPSWAHPVVAGGVLYVRDQHTLTAYKVR
ncbi:MAG: hypothetical protein ACI9G1_002410 [Pirellulaceae bacterium]|jgi:hypothetical protein